MDVHTKEQRSYNMSRVKSKNTGPEVILFQILKKSGYKFKRHYGLPGKPDIVFVKNRLAVFVDGEFWHGKDFDLWKDKLSSFWSRKIDDNLKRDRKNDRQLKKLGWRVIHFWGRDVVKKADKVLLRIDKMIKKSHSD